MVTKVQQIAVTVKSGYCSDCRNSNKISIFMALARINEINPNKFSDNNCKYNIHDTGSGLDAAGAAGGVVESGTGFRR